MVHYTQQLNNFGFRKKKSIMIPKINRFQLHCTKY